MKVTIGEETFEMTEEQARRYAVCKAIILELRKLPTYKDLVRVLGAVLGTTAQIFSPEARLGFILHMTDMLATITEHSPEFDKLQESADKTGVPLETLLKDLHDSRTERRTPPAD